MCGRFSLFVPQSAVEERFDATFDEPWTPQYNIAPGERVPAIRNGSPGTIDQLEWGLLPGWVDDVDGWPRPINARAETVAEKPSFRDAFEARRCLVVADGFSEWRGERGHKQPYRVEHGDHELVAFAGLWETWSADGETVETATILTTDANEVVAPIHDRMPVVLTPEEEARWLAAEDEADLAALLDPYPADRTEAYPISTKVNDPDYERPDVLDPVDVAEQSDLGEFE